MPKRKRKFTNWETIQIWFWAKGQEWKAKDPVQLAKEIQDHVENMDPIKGKMDGTAVWLGEPLDDLLIAALESVNYGEIANAILEGWEGLIAESID